MVCRIALNTNAIEVPVLSHDPFDGKQTPICRRDRTTKHQTLNLKPQTLNPKPQILNSKTQTLNPKP